MSFSMGLRSLESLRLLGNRETVKDVQASFIAFAKSINTIASSPRTFVVESVISLSPSPSVRLRPSIP